MPMAQEDQASSKWERVVKDDYSSNARASSRHSNFRTENNKKKNMSKYVKVV